jgi:hypothetical protein
MGSQVRHVLFLKIEEIKILQEKEENLLLNALFVLILYLL